MAASVQASQPPFAFTAGWLAGSAVRASSFNRSHHLVLLSIQADREKSEVNEDNSSHIYITSYFNPSAEIFIFGRTVKERDRDWKPPPF
jgi:hypothetical protein